MTDIREVIAETIDDWDDMSASKLFYSDIADAVLAAVEAAPVEQRLAWAARVAIAAAIQAGADV